MFKLGIQRIRKWCDGIWQEKAQLRTAKASSKKNDKDDAPTIRKRKATANRILTVLKLTIGKQSNDLIFLRSDGQKWGRSHQERRIKDAAQATKIADVSCQALRHAHASMLVKQAREIMPLLLRLCRLL